MSKSPPQFGTKRKFVKKVIKKPKVTKVANEPKRYINSLTGNRVLRLIYLKAVREKERRENEWLDTKRKVEEMSIYMQQKVEKETGNTINLLKIDMTLYDARHY